MDWTVTTNNRPDPTGKRRRLPLSHPSTSVTVGEEAGRPSQNRTVSAGNSVLLPANTRGSTGVMKMDGVGSGALQALQPRWCVGSSRPRDWSWAGRGGSSGTPWGCSGPSPLQGLSCWQKAPWFRPRRLFGGLSSLLGPPGSPGGGGWIREARSQVSFLSLLPFLASSLKSQLVQTLPPLPRLTAGLGAQPQASVIPSRYQA